MKRPALGLLAAALAALAACASFPEEAPRPAWPEVELASLGEARNVFRCGPLWISGLPGPEELDLARRRGLVGVVDLREPGEGAPFDPAQEARRQGLTYLRLALDFQAPEALQVERLLEELDKPGERLLFCANGSRAAAALALHRAVSQGLPVELALAEARRVGMKPGPAEDFVRAEALRRRPQAGG